MESTPEGHDAPAVVGHRTAAEWKSLAGFRESAIPRSAAALLTGFTLGWLISAVVEYLGGVFRPPASGEAMVAGCLLATALGTRLPRGLASWLAYLAWHRRFRKRTDPSGHDDRTRRPPPSDAPAFHLVASGELNPVPSAGHLSADTSSAESGSGPGDGYPGFGKQPDIQLLWMILATVAMLAGLAVATMPMVAGGAEWVYGLAMARFLWMPLPHVLLTMFIAFLVSVIPLSLIGFVLACVNQLGRPDGQCGDGSLSWALLGCGSGAGAVLVLKHSVMPGELLMVLASLPMFLAAIVATQQSRFPSVVRHSPLDGLMPPEVGHGDRMVSRAATTMVTVAAAGTAIFWIGLLSMSSGPLIPSEKVLAVMLWSSAVGAGAASYGARGCASWSRGFAVPCAVAAVVNFAALAGFVALAHRNDPVIAAARVVLACVAVIVSVHAVMRARQTVLAQSSAHNAAGVSLVAETAWVPAVALLMSAAGNLQREQQTIGLAAVSLGLGAVGALMVFYEREYSSKRPRIRRAAVLGSFMLMAFMLPGTVRRWSNRSPDHPPRASFAPSVPTPDKTPTPMPAIIGPETAS